MSCHFLIWKSRKFSMLHVILNTKNRHLRSKYQLQNLPKAYKYSFFHFCYFFERISEPPIIFKHNMSLPPYNECFRESLWVAWRSQREELWLLSRQMNQNDLHKVLFHSWSVKHANWGVQFASNYFWEI